MIYFDILFRPEKTLNDSTLNRRLNGVTGIVTLTIISALALIWILKIGNVPGGNPSLWYGFGVLLDLKFTQSLSYLQLWLFLLPIKLIGDAGLILIPGFIALKYYRCSKEQLWLWSKVYCYTLTAIDIFWLMALAPAAIFGATGRPMLITNLITFMVCGANILIFTNAYRCIFHLSFDRALYGWFIAGVAVPVIIIAALMGVLQNI